MKKVIEEGLYALRISADPVGAMLRAAGYLPFTGASISLAVEADENVEEEIARRKVEYLRERDAQGLLEMPGGGYLIPAGWDEALVAYLSQGRIRGGKMERLLDIQDPVEWERFPLIPNSGYGGNKWEYVYPGWASFERFTPHSVE